MQDPNFLHNTAIVLLNYMTTEEPLEMLASCKSYYPDIRVVIVDNGSSDNVVQQLENIANKHKNVSVLPLKENTGFARGNNAGIEKLREEGYQYICCSNSDIVFTKEGILENLKSALIDMGAAIAGPKIRSANGEYHRVFVNHPTPSMIKSRYLKYNYLLLYKVLRLTRLICNDTLKQDEVNQLINSLSQETGIYVYQLHGAFLMFGPLFFSAYQGFDPNTFLYGEEVILADMLRQKNMNAVFVPSAEVSHSEDKTSNALWGKSEKKNKFKHKRDSFNFWYKKYYITSRKNKD